jgi:hypothetical protein
MIAKPRGGDFRPSVNAILVLPLVEDARRRLSTDDRNAFGDTALAAVFRRVSRRAVMLS